MSLRLWLVLAITVVIGCSDMQNRNGSYEPYMLDVAVHYGWANMADSTRKLSDLDRRASAGVLGTPMDVVEGPEGEVYILDAAFLKIAIFDSMGNYLRSIMGGGGQGPGEFSRPRSIALDGLGGIWVKDQLQQRITRFDSTGQASKTVRGPPAHYVEIAYYGGRLFVTRVSGSGARLVILDTTGVLVDSAGIPNSLTAGSVLVSSGGLGLAAGGGVIFADPIVGLWRHIRVGDEGVIRGGVLHPEQLDTDLIGGNGRRVVDIWNAGRFQGGPTFVYYASKLESDSAQYKLALFDSVGIHLQTLAVPATGGTFGHSISRRDIFIEMDDPYPRIVRMRLRPAGK